LFLEIERIANHLGDLGYMGNDVALSFGFMQFWRLKEDWLRLTARLFGHRYLFDCIVPGGVAVDLTDAAPLLAELNRLQAEVHSLKAIYDEQPVLQDRFANTGTVKPELAARLGLTGLPGRASAQAWDIRTQFPSAPYDRLNVNMATHRKGDVYARSEVRFAEMDESLRLIREVIRQMPVGAIRNEVGVVKEVTEGIGWVESWRGPVIVALRIGREGRLDRVHPHDPSWQNWPLLEIGIIGNIVPDFPLINKSFNLSYSGPDL
jgi:Ni,Fe-hydrogenase III large subunit